MNYAHRERTCGSPQGPPHVLPNQHRADRPRGHFAPVFSSGESPVPFSPPTTFTLSSFVLALPGQPPGPGSSRFQLWHSPHLCRGVPEPQRPRGQPHSPISPYKSGRKVRARGVNVNPAPPGSQRNLQRGRAARPTRNNLGYANLKEGGLHLQTPPTAQVNQENSLFSPPDSSI